MIKYFKAVYLMICIIMVIYLIIQAFENIELTRIELLLKFWKLNLACVVFAIGGKFLIDYFENKYHD